MEDFSTEHLFIDEDDYDLTKRMRVSSCQQLLLGTIAVLNSSRNKYLETKDKDYWWQMIQLLPSSYNQRRTVMLNYEVLANIYKYRKNHKLDEWVELCKWIETLPYSELITSSDFKDIPMCNKIMQEAEVRDKINIGVDLAKGLDMTGHAKEK